MLNYELVRCTLPHSHVIAQTKALRKAGIPIKQEQGTYLLQDKEGRDIYRAMKIGAVWAVAHVKDLFN